MRHHPLRWSMTSSGIILYIYKGTANSEIYKNFMLRAGLHSSKDIFTWNSDSWIICFQLLETCQVFRDHFLQETNLGFERMSHVQSSLPSFAGPLPPHLWILTFRKETIYNIYIYIVHILLLTQNWHPSADLLAALPLVPLHQQLRKTNYNAMPESNYTLATVKSQLSTPARDDNLNGYFSIAWTSGLIFFSLSRLVSASFVGQAGFRW